MDHTVGEALPEAGADSLQIVADVREHPLGKNACYIMDVIDTKVASIVTYIGILIAALLLFMVELIPSGGGFRVGLSTETVAVIGLALLACAAVLSLSCVYIVNIEAVARKTNCLEETIERLHAIAMSRKRRYLTSLTLTIFATLVAVAAIGAAIYETTL